MTDVEAANMGGTERAVLGWVKQHNGDAGAAALIDDLHNGQGISEVLLQQTVWNLINQKWIAINKDLHLMLAGEFQSAVGMPPI
jgi:hypothetical protein